jgi:hypothetical protein
MVWPFRVEAVLWSDGLVDRSVSWKFLGSCHLPLVRLSVIIFLLKLPEYLFYNWSLSLTTFTKSRCNLTVKGTWLQEGSLYQINYLHVCAVHPVMTFLQGVNGAGEQHILHVNAGNTTFLQATVH